MDPLHIKVSKPLDALGVAYIRALYKVWGLTSTEITGITGVANTTVRDILTRRTWAHEPEGLTSWDGTHGRHDYAPLDYGCGDAHPERSDVWCFRGAGHRGRHLWVEPWRTQSESTAWLALELRAVVQEPVEIPQEPVEVLQEPDILATAAGDELTGVVEQELAEEAEAGHEAALLEVRQHVAEATIEPIEELLRRRERVRELGRVIVNNDAELLERLAR